jgi:hypothetical protein
MALERSGDLAFVYIRNDGEAQNLIWCGPTTTLCFFLWPPALAARPAPKNPLLLPPSNPHPGQADQPEEHLRQAAAQHAQGLHRAAGV